MSNDVDFAECQQCLCLAARVEAQRLTRMFDERAAAVRSGTINQFTLLATLIVGGPASGDAASRPPRHRPHDLDAQPVACRARGLVKDKPGEDSRERLIEITAAGRELAATAFPAWQAAQQQAKALR